MVFGASLKIPEMPHFWTKNPLKPCPAHNKKSGAEAPPVVFERSLKYVM
jgi:hypothetical protein